jgi:hypothetical protein
MFTAKMKKENRNAILFLENATCHPKVTNTFKCENRLVPSVLQYMDKGLFTLSNLTTNDP